MTLKRVLFAIIVLLMMFLYMLILDDDDDFYSMTRDSTNFFELSQAQSQEARLCQIG